MSGAQRSRVPGLRSLESRRGCRRRRGRRGVQCFEVVGAADGELDRPAGALPVAKTYQVSPSRAIDGSWVPATSPESLRACGCWATAKVVRRSRRAARGDVRVMLSVFRWPCRKVRPSLRGVYSGRGVAVVTPGGPARGEGGGGEKDDSGDDGLRPDAVDAPLLQDVGLEVGEHACGGEADLRKLQHGPPAPQHGEDDHQPVADDAEGRDGDVQLVVSAASSKERGGKTAKREWLTAPQSKCSVTAQGARRRGPCCGRGGRGR